MRALKFSMLPLLALCGLGCATTTTSYVEANATLGRVVVYRNGIAYFERTAEVSSDSFELNVPADKVDDFLKSLTVLDADTKQPAPIAYPTKPPGGDSGLVAMKIRLKDGATKPRKLLLSYVTEAPSWKPSYRIVLGDAGKVDLQAWAIVDNTSGEDWKSVKLGVGSSSALSFRFDLHSVRNVARETLAPTDLFAQAPPTGMPVYANGAPASATGLLDVMDDASLAQVDLRARFKEVEEQAGTKATRKPTPNADKKGKGQGFSGRDGAGLGAVGGGRAAKPPAEPAAPAMNDQEYRVLNLAQRVQNENRRVVVEGFASKDDGDRGAAALERANKLRDQLIASGVAPDQIEAVANTALTTDRGGARVLDAAATGEAGEKKPADGAANGGAMLDAIGASHFESKTPMTVERGTSAMVSILHSSTDGEVVYLYDPESARGNATYAFRSVRLTNPTDSTLETGPVTVFGQGRFIGEGLTDPIPGKSASFIPYALDRQVVVEAKEEEHDGISKIITAQRGVLSTEMKHTRRQVLSLKNRLDEAATVYVRHTVQKGYTLTKHPEKVERFGEAHLFRIDVPAHGEAEVTIEEETPIVKSVDIRSTAGMDLVRAFVQSATIEPALATKLKALIELQQEVGTIEERIETQREQMNEYRGRMDELHAQLVTLKAVKTAGPLMRNLEKKMEEFSDKVSKSTVDLVALEEQRMIARIKLQDGVAELTLDKRAVADKGEKKGPTAQR